MWLPRPSLVKVVQASFAAARSGWASESARAGRRSAYVLALVVALGLLGPYLIASSIFPGRRTAIDGGDPAARCTYDASLAQSSGRLAPQPTPSPAIAGQAGSFEVTLRNAGTCDWGPGVALKHESGALTHPQETISVTAVISRSGRLSVQIPYVTPADAGVVNSTWRMHAPDDRGFGETISFAVVTHREGEAPRYPRPPLLSSIALLAIGAVLLPGVIGLAFALERAGRFTRQFYGLKSDRHGREYVMRRLFSPSQGAAATASEGELRVDADSEAIEKIGGPGALSVHSSTAVLLERGGGFSRIVGPGKTLLQPFERARVVIDLRTLNRKKTEMATTKDGIDVKADTTVTFRLAKQKADEKIPDPKADVPWWSLFRAWLGFKVRSPAPPEKIPASPDAIRAFVYDLPAGTSWDGTVSSGLGDEIPQRLLDELWAPEDPEHNPRSEIIERLLSKGRESLSRRGIELIDLSVGPWEVTDVAVDQQRREFWQQHWESRARVIEAEGEAEALRQQQTARAEAQAELIQTIAHSFRMIALGGTPQPSQQVALRMLEVVGRTMKSTLEDAREKGPPADRARRILDRLQDLVNS